MACFCCTMSEKQKDWGWPATRHWIYLEIPGTCVGKAQTLSLSGTADQSLAGSLSFLLPSLSRRHAFCSGCSKGPGGPGLETDLRPRPPGYGLGWSSSLSFTEVDREGCWESSYPLTVILYIINKTQYCGNEAWVSGVCFKASWGWDEQGRTDPGLQVVEAGNGSQQFLIRFPRLLHSFEILHNKKYKKTSHPPQ